MTEQEKKKKKKQQQSILEAEIYALINQSMKVAVDEALKKIFKGWK